MKYIVIVATIKGNQEKEFFAYREALCFATNFRREKISKIPRKNVVINEFNY